MYIKLKIGQLPTPSVGSIKATLYDSDGVKTLDLDMNSVVIDLIEELHIEVSEGELSICNHESDGVALLSKPPKYKCKKCGSLYLTNKPGTQ